MHRIFSIFLSLFLLLNTGLVVAQTPDLQTDYDPAELLAIKPEMREQIAARLPFGLTEYEIEITVPDADISSGMEISGKQHVTVTNTSGEPLTELPFRLYANGAHHDHNALEITSVQIGGEPIDWEMSVADSVATIPLDSGLGPAEAITIEMDFVLSVPVDEASHYGILNHSTSNETTVLAHWYPVLAGWDPLTGWMLKPSSQYGDPIFTDAGMYEVTIIAPGTQKLITSGIETNQVTLADKKAVTFNAKPSRDFVIVMSETLEPHITEVDGTTITSWSLPHHQEGGEAVMEWTANSLNAFNPLLGEYPWLELQAIEAAVYSAAAVELPQMFIMGSSFYSGSNVVQPLSYFEFTVAHEVVHMWFYSLVGNNQYDYAYIDEGITNYLSGDIYFRVTYGESTGDTTHQTFLYRPFQRMIEGNSDVIVDFPTDDFPNQNAYVNAVYTKAPLGFHAIHMAMGDDPFFGALAAYVEDHSFRVATPADLEAAFQAHTDVNIREIWSHWFERREGGLDIQEAQSGDKRTAVLKKS